MGEENPGDAVEAGHAPADDGYDLRARPEDRRALASRMEAVRSHSDRIARERDSNPALPDDHYLIPRNWNVMAFALAAAFITASLATLSSPPSTLIAPMFSAAGLAALGSWFARSERQEKPSAASRYLIASIGLVAPLFLTGLVFGLWAREGSLAWQWCIGALVCINVTAATLLGRRAIPLLAATIACWLPVVLSEASSAGFEALIGATAALYLVGRYQWRLDRERVAAELAHERIRTRAEGILRDYEETGHDWFWETDRRGELTYLSHSVAKTMTSGEAPLLGRSFAELFDGGDSDIEGERSIRFHLSARFPFQELPLRVAAAEDERWWSVSGRPIHDGFGNFCGFRGSGSDLTEQRRAHENVARLARCDSLTGLANRFQMNQSLEKILAAGQEKRRECAIMLLDLDRFKNVNDSLGHPVGDQLLKQVAQRLQRTVDRLGRVGRLGGDEFQVLLPGLQSRRRLTQLAEEIIYSLSQPYTLVGQRIVIGVSIGIAIAPADGETADSLIRNADLALYAAKDGGRGRMHFYSEDLHYAAEERNRLEQDLRDAMEDGRLELYYQPVVQASTEKIAGFEALLRWNHPTRGWLSPGKFVPIAEDRGLIAAIGEWALRTACLQLAQWPEQLRCAVNVSPLQFADANLPLVVRNAVARAGIDPTRLELEITESIFLNDDIASDATFAALKNIGVRLALDDFGTGYSALGYLKKAPFDRIKIDQSFVRGAAEADSRNGAIIASITSLAHALGMETTAEGVETLDELELVRQFGCSHVQGHIYEAAITGEQATQRLAVGLAAVAEGPRSARTKRHTMLRKITVEQGGQRSRATIRNLSATGALIEGVEGITGGSSLRVIFSEKQTSRATCRWASDDRIGVEFDKPLSGFAAGPETGSSWGPRPPLLKSA